MLVFPIESRTIVRCDRDQSFHIFSTRLQSIPTNQHLISLGRCGGRLSRSFVFVRFSRTKCEIVVPKIRAVEVAIAEGPGRIGEVLRAEGYFLGCRPRRAPRGSIRKLCNPTESRYRCLGSTAWKAAQKLCNRARDLNIARAHRHRRIVRKSRFA
jgi:hypothetical protein